MSAPLESGDLPTVVVNPEASFEPVRDAILDLREKVEDLCNQELGKITKQGPPTRLFIEFCPIYILLFLISSSVSLPVNDTTLFTLADGEFPNAPLQHIHMQMC